MQLDALIFDNHHITEELNRLVDLIISKQVHAEGESIQHEDDENDNIKVENMKDYQDSFLPPIVQHKSSIIANDGDAVSMPID